MKIVEGKNTDQTTMKNLQTFALFVEDLGVAMFAPTSCKIH